MKKSFSTLVLVCFSLTMVAQENRHLAEEFAAAEQNRATYWKPGLYQKAVESMRTVYDMYFTADSAEKSSVADKFEKLTYDMACGYSLLREADSAATYLQKYYDLAYATYSTYYRETDYYHLQRDSCLDAIRSNGRFQDVLARFKGVSWETLLKEYGVYEARGSKLPPFVYVNEDWEGLPQLRTKYRLDSIAGSGDDVSRMINLMKWVHGTIPHDGNSGEPADRHADALIEISRKEEHGLNCWMLATVLNEMYLATGLRSRTVSCYPKGDPSITHEWHVIVEAFSPSRKKWLLMDPSLETFVTDEKGDLLSIAEVRERLVHGLTVRAAPEINRNGEPLKDGGEKYLHDYMMKNLFRISIPLFSFPAYEMYPRKIRIYVELLPKGYNPRNVRFHEITGARSSVIYTTDDKQFWAPPVLD